MKNPFFDNEPAIIFELERAYKVGEKAYCCRRGVGAVIRAHYTRDTVGWAAAEAANWTPIQISSSVDYIEIIRCEDEKNCTGQKPTGHFGCLRVIHAEINAAILAMRAGVDLSTGVMYCTTKPCLECAKFLVLVGIQRVYYCEENEGIDPKFADLIAGLEMIQYPKEKLDLTGIRN